MMRKIARELKKSGYTFGEEKTPDKKASDVHDAPIRSAECRRGRIRSARATKRA